MGKMMEGDISFAVEHILGAGDIAGFGYHSFKKA